MSYLDVAIVRDVDVAPVDELMIGPDGLLNIVPAWKLKEFPHQMLQVWCVKRGVYQFPTEELIGWLSAHIAGRSAIEINAGNGAIGRALGIRSVDNYMQTFPPVANHYRSIGQEPITPPPDVVRLDSNAAVRQYQPQVVVGAWVTQIGEIGEPNTCAVGVDELELIRRAEYVHVGNDNTHGQKRIMRHLHETIRHEWLISRAIDPTCNYICVWARRR